MDSIDKRALELYLKGLPQMKRQGDLGRYSDTMPYGIKERITPDLEKALKYNPETYIPQQEGFNHLYENWMLDEEKRRVLKLQDIFRNQGIDKGQWFQVPGREPRNVNDLFWNLGGMVRG